MAWLKRNLYFTIGGVIALTMMGFGAYFLYTQIAKESDLAEQIKAQYAELTRLKNLNPHPGDEKIDNVKLAREQQADLRAYAAKISPFFQPIPSIPESTNKISKADFAAQLRNTVALLRREATNQGVVLKPDYYFTFESQKRVLTFDPASLSLLAVKLGEIKAICDVLFDAKINSLISLRRESVSTDDNVPDDFLLTKTTPTRLADLSPYEVTFQCFSSQLAQVMSSLASSPNAFIVKTINVDPAGETGEETANAAPGAAMPAPVNPYRPRGYGFPGESGFRPMPAPVAVAPAAHGNQVFLNEKPLRITLLIYIVKFKPAAK